MMIVRNGLCFCSAKLDSGAVMVHGMIIWFLSMMRARMVFAVL